MSRKLEDFIKENKWEFELNEPGKDSWARLAEKLDAHVPARPVKEFWKLGIAASLVVIGILATIYAYHNFPRKTIDVADVNPVYTRKQMKFVNLIEQKRDSLEVFAKTNPILYEQFNNDLSRLVTNYELLKQELKRSPNQKVVVKAMVKNLELQLQVISQQLDIISEVEEYKRENQI